LRWVQRKELSATVISATVLLTQRTALLRSGYRSGVSARTLGWL